MKKIIMTVAVLLMITQYQNRVIATDKVDAEILTKTQIFAEQKLGNIEQFQKSSQANQIKIVAQKAGGNSQSASKKENNQWMIVVGGFIFAVFMLSRIRL